MIKINIDKRRNYLADQARTQRDLMLSECDGKMAIDSTSDKTAWTAYRQALRDVTEQEGFPETITWPLKPE